MKHSKAYIAGATALAGAAFVAGPLVTGASASTEAPASKTAPARALSSVTGAYVSVAPGANGLASVSCPTGKVVSGGGGQTSAFGIEFTDSYASGNGWTIRGNNHGTTTQSIRAVAVCLGLS